MLKQSNSFNKALSKHDLFELFESLNYKLKINNLNLVITIYGGSVMTLLYDGRPATKDIDYMVNSDTNEKLLESIIDEMSVIYNLPKDWMNNDVKEPLQFILKEETYDGLSYSNLTIMIPKAEQLLAMKILSARPEPSKDFIDAELLCKTLGVKQKKEVIEIFSRFFPKKLLGQRQIMFIHYVGVDLGYDW